MRLNDSNNVHNEPLIFSLNHNILNKYCFKSVDELDSSITCIYAQEMHDEYTLPNLSKQLILILEILHGKKKKKIK